MREFYRRRHGNGNSAWIGASARHEFNVVARAHDRLRIDSCACIEEAQRAADGLAHPKGCDASCGEWTRVPARGGPWLVPRRT